jgi:cyanamide hydratase
MSSTPEKAYGFTPVLSSPESLFTASSTLKSKVPPPCIPVSATPTPSTPLSRRIQAYAKFHLPEPTYNHSLRVYHYGLAIKRYAFPEWEFDDETYFLTCLLHDIGTTGENLRATKLSFEFFGGYLALDVLQHDRDDVEEKATAVAPRAQAESVAEAIIRHQDLRDVGSITAVGQLVQLATIFGILSTPLPSALLSMFPQNSQYSDNTGGHAHLIHEDTVTDVIEHYPRLKWSSCFARTVEEEVGLKPWAHTTVLGDFKGHILGNPFNRFE